MNGDTELLRRYVEDRSEAAFAELVRLHLNLVYFAALRQVGGDTHRAKDVAQTVFTDLARKARSLTGRATLTGWLHTSTRFAATKARRADFSRQQHEQEATTMNVLLSDPNPAAEWDRLRPMIDDVIHELDERDREAVLLRYFENRPFAEIGATLRVSEDAARMRVDRALEKLRGALARRGMKSTSAALAAAFANQVGASAPAGLASTIAGTALASVGSSAVVGAGILMSTKSTLIVSVVALAAIGSTFLQWIRAQRAEVEVAALTLDRDSLRRQLSAEQQRAKRSKQDLAALQGKIDSLKIRSVAPPSPPPVVSSSATPADELRRASINKAVLNNLRSLSAAVDQFTLKNGRSPGSIAELVGEGKYIRQLDAVAGEDYSGISLAAGGVLTVTIPDGDTLSYTPDTKVAPTPERQRANELRTHILPAFKKAYEAYRTTHNGEAAPSEQDLIPYFATPQEGADFVEFLEAQKAAKKNN